MTTTEYDNNGVPLPAMDAAAECHVLGTALMSTAGLGELRQLTAEHFTPGPRRTTYEIITDLDEHHTPVTPETVYDELIRRGYVDTLNPGVFLLTLQQSQVPQQDLGYWIDKVQAVTRSRQLLWAGQRLIQLAGLEPSDDRDKIVAHTLDTLAATGVTTNDRKRFVTGGEFLFDRHDHTRAVWGRDDDVLWADGEALMICGPSGVGKTTLAGQLLAGRLGLLTEVLSYPMMAGTRRVLYLAMDRPPQAARSIRRLFHPDYRDVLDERLTVWQGPPPHDLAVRTDQLLRLCEQADADTVIVDSLKDAALGLSDDAVGAGYNRARQAVLVAGIQVVELHHQRKAGNGGGPPSAIDDVYGSTWLTAGAGSVVVLWGAPGDPVVELRHLKQPMGEVGPLRVLHDNLTGLSSVYHTIDVLALVRRSRHGVTAKAAATAVFDTDKPTAAQVEKSRRRLDALVSTGQLVRRDGDRGGGSARSPSTYHDAKFARFDDPGDDH